MVGFFRGNSRRELNPRSGSAERGRTGIYSEHAAAEKAKPLSRKGHHLITCYYYRMKKKISLVILVIVIGLASWAIYSQLNNGGGASNKSVESAPETTSTNQAEYKKCVDAGGIRNTSVAPSSCLLNGKTYYDGNL